MKNIFISIFMLLSMIVCQVQISDAYTDTSNNEITIGETSDGIPVINTENITIEDATNYVKEKGGVLVGFIQNIAKPITVVVMVISGLMAIITSLTGGKDGASRWFGSFIIAGLCYSGVIFAPAILSLLTGFLAPY